MASHVVNVTEFKAKCLALIEEISTSGGSITVTKRGQPVAELSPVKRKKYKSPMGLLAGQLEGFEEALDGARAEWRQIQEKKWENGV